MVGNWTTVDSLKAGDRADFGDTMTGIITEVTNEDGMTTIKVKDIVIFYSFSDTRVLAFFAEKNKESFFFK